MSICQPTANKREQRVIISVSRKLDDGGEANAQNHNPTFKSIPTSAFSAWVLQVLLQILGLPC
uniref:Uncharacterized protein n=1 Tax=Rhizophora mucronata TaxID=61149 RepID=A0A2P2KGZ2_RHIMU